MMNKKTQEMSIQTVVVLILIMVVLVIVIAFAVPQLTGMLGGMDEIGDSVLNQTNTTVNLTI
jgi:ABC-type cobalt transport system substrate-binding protein